MNKTVAFLGLGIRGRLYFDLVSKEKNFTISAVCDPDQTKTQFLKESNIQVFNSTNEFLKSKRADAIIIASPDKCHYSQIAAALKLGYDVLAEKPAALEKKQCRELVKQAKKTGRIFAVCYVLRYMPFFNEINKIIREGTIGNIVHVSLKNNIGYWHFAHSFVRGNWSESKEAGSLILSKGCHDIDIINSIVNKECLSVSSFGQLNFFNKNNKPKNAADYCFLCNENCKYKAETIYRERQGLTKYLINESSSENLNEKLKDKNIKYNRCVFNCCNNIVDHNSIILYYKGGITANLTLNAFSEVNYRQVSISGTMGEITGDLIENKIILKHFGGSQTEIDCNNDNCNRFNHFGADEKLVKEFLTAVETQSSIDCAYTYMPYKIAFAAEKSRKNRGKKIEIN